MNSEDLILKIIGRAVRRGDVSPGVVNNPKIYLTPKEIEALLRRHIKTVVSSDGKLTWDFIGDAILQHATKLYKWDTRPIGVRCKIAIGAGLSGKDGGKSWTALGRANRDKIRTFLKAKRENKSVPAPKTVKVKKHKKLKKE